MCVGIYIYIKPFRYISAFFTFMSSSSSFFLHTFIYLFRKNPNLGPHSLSRSTGRAKYMGKNSCLRHTGEKTINGGRFLFAIVVTGQYRKILTLLSHKADISNELLVLSCTMKTGSFHKLYNQLWTRLGIIPPNLSFIFFLLSQADYTPRNCDARPIKRCNESPAFSGSETR